MFYLILTAAALLFIAHVVLLFTSFQKSALLPTRYFYSHLTLWLTGVLVFVLALLYSGTGQLLFLDYFDTMQKKMMILVFTFALSLVAHFIVRLLVLPLLKPKS
ncbi:hypothetical protein [Mucilaginibacter sp. UYCu711]|uniref:hypothetical protein n=1 Tax=Mucilaginibacter sp. UYCu711 TaxID=3156339 RepID=UPI003D1D26B7